MNVMIIRLISINVQCYRIHNLRSCDVILHICTCGFGILANFDAVLRFLTFFHAVLRFLTFFFSCGFAVFAPPPLPLLRAPPSDIDTVTLMGFLAPRTQEVLYLTD